MQHIDVDVPFSDARDAVTVVVVTFNSAHCMSALANHLCDWPNSVIVDNGSEDDSARVAAHLLPQAQVLALPQNLGFGAANNRGVALAKTPYVLLLNPDCEISATQIDALFERMRDDTTVGLLGPQLMRSSGVPEVNYRMAQSDWPPKTLGAEGPLCVGFVCGAVMMIRVTAFLEISGFDERFFLYYEDDDLCLRLSRAGYGLLIEPSVQVLHRSRGSVRTRKPTRGEYLRGFHHAQSKLSFTAIHQSASAARRQRAQLVASTLLLLAPRLLLWSPRHLARAWGRLLGAWRWRIQQASLD